MPFHCDIYVCFVEEIRLIRGETADNVTVIFSSVVLNRSVFGVSVPVGVENPSSRKYIVENAKEILKPSRKSKDVFPLPTAKMCPLIAHDISV